MGSGAAGVDDAMNTVNPSASGATEPSADWMDRLLRFDAAEHSDDYIDDAGFTARVMHELPVADATVCFWLGGRELGGLFLSW